MILFLMEALPMLVTVSFFLFKSFISFPFLALFFVFVFGLRVHGRMEKEEGGFGLCSCRLSNILVKKKL